MLHIRPFRSMDAEKIVTWTSDEVSFYKWSAGILGSYPLTAQRLLEATSGRLDNEKYYPFTAFDENGPVGFFTIRILGERNEIARFGFVIVDPTIRGKGYGRQMLELGCKFAFELFGSEKASLGVFDNNPNALRCYLAAGFRDTGERETYPMCGEQWTCIEMEKDDEQSASFGICH